MAKDKRYSAVKPLILAGGINTIPEIFQFIPRKVVYTDMGINYARFRRLVESPQHFTLNDLTIIANLFEVEPRLIIDIAMSSISSPKKSRPRRK